MDEESKGFVCLRQIIPKMSDAKKKERIFAGPQIK